MFVQNPYSKQIQSTAVFLPLHGNKSCEWPGHHLRPPGTGATPMVPASATAAARTQGRQSALLQERKIRLYSKNIPCLLTILLLTEICRYWLWYCKHDSLLNVSWINWLIKKRIALWAGLNWLIKHSIALIACMMGKGTKGGEKKERGTSTRPLMHYD